MHTELLSYSATQPNTGLAAAAVTGDSLVVKNSRSKASALAIWGSQQVDGWQQIITPSAHDTTRGLRLVVDLSESAPLLPWGVSLDLQPQETISITIAGSNVAGDVELGCMLIHYPDLPGVSSRGMTWAALGNKIDKITTIQATITGAATGYTGDELITSESDLLMANRDYAVLGYETSVACGAIGIIGPDTGYCRQAGPGTLDADITRDWWCQLARAHDMALIPVINSGNKASTKIFILQNENNVSPVISLTLALLK
jgi:hypothetical protein